MPSKALHILREENEFSLLINYTHLRHAIMRKYRYSVGSKILISFNDAIVHLFIQTTTLTLM